MIKKPPTILPPKLLICEGGLRKWGKIEVDRLVASSTPARPQTIVGKYLLFGFSDAQVALVSIIEFSSWEIYQELSHPDIADLSRNFPGVLPSSSSAILGGGSIRFTLFEESKGAISLPPFNPSFSFYGLSDTYGSPSATLLRLCVENFAQSDTLVDLVSALDEKPISVNSRSSDLYSPGFDKTSQKAASEFYRELVL